jgi:hypothetical protein
MEANPSTNRGDEIILWSKMEANLSTNRGEH